MRGMANEPAKPGGKLTANQRRFVEEYAVDRNATQAYFRAFGRNKSDGTPRTYQTAATQSFHLLKNPKIQRELRSAEAAMRRRLRVNRERIIRELAGIAFFDPSDVFAPDPSQNNAPTPRPWNALPATARRVISRVKIKRSRRADADGVTFEVEDIDYHFHDKDAAFARLTKLLGLDDAVGEDDKQAGGVVELLPQDPVPDD